MILRYILIAGYDYESWSWGQGYQGEHATVEAATEAGREIKKGWDWWQVIDLMTKEVVAESGADHG